MTDRMKAKAKALRDKELAELTELYAACTCAYPITTYRNMHGHDDSCPAVKVWERLHDAAT